MLSDQQKENQTDINTGRHTYMHINTNRKTERQKDRKTEKQKDRKTERQKDRKTYKQREM